MSEASPNDSEASAEEPLSLEPATGKPAAAEASMAEEQRSEVGSGEPSIPAAAEEGSTVEAPAERGQREGMTAMGLPESWKVHLPIFEGPLDLLLHLIRINEVDVYDIPVLLICDQFHEYLSLMEELDLDIAGEFIYEAALLIQLKSRMLLPKPKVEEGEEEEDPREVLVQRLLEYQRMKEAAQELGEVDRLRMGMWTRDAGPPDLKSDDPDEVDLGDLSLFDLLAAFKRVLVRYDREHPPPIHLRGESYSVRDQFNRLLRILDAGRPYDLLDDLRLLTCRAEAVAAFLAILELAKLNLIRLHQTEKGEILLHRTTREMQDHELELIEG